MRSSERVGLSVPISSTGASSLRTQPWLNCPSLIYDCDDSEEAIPWVVLTCNISPVVLKVMLLFVRLALLLLILEGVFSQLWLEAGIDEWMHKWGRERLAIPAQQILTGRRVLVSRSLSEPLGQTMNITVLSKQNKAWKHVRLYKETPKPLGPY